MTELQKEKLKKLGKRVLDCYENNAGELVVTLRYGTKYFCKTFIGIRGGMTYKLSKVYKEYTKKAGLTGFIFEDYN